MWLQPHYLVQRDSIVVIHFATAKDLVDGDSGHIAGVGSAIPMLGVDVVVCEVCEHIHSEGLLSDRVLARSHA